MNALLLAAGFGSRLRPITDKIPKCLVPIHGVPLLEIWLSKIFYAGISRVVINTHYLSNLVTEFVESSQWRRQVDLFDEPILLGTGGTLVATRNLLGEGPILVIHADNLSAINLSEFKTAHFSRPKKCEMTMAIFKTDTPQSCGIVELGSDDCVISMYEKVSLPPSNLANAAVYMIEPEILSRIKVTEGREFDISTEIIPPLLGKIYSYPITEYHRDIGSPLALSQAHQDMTEKEVRALMSTNERKSNCWSVPTG